MRTERSSGGSGHTWRDSIGLVLIATLITAPYVTRIGFYGDDWLVLATFHRQVAQHQLSIGSALHEFGARPLQGVYLAALYRLFGLRPLFYHLVNSAVLALTAPLMYQLFLRLNIDRARALASAILFLVLPQLSTVRVWMVTFQIPLSMVAAFGSMHCQLSFVRTGRATWASAAAALFAASAGLYEIFAPLVASFPFVLLTQPTSSPEKPQKRRAALLLIGTAVLATLALALKLARTDRVVTPDLQRYSKGLYQLVRVDYNWQTDYALNIFAAAEVHFGWPFIGAAHAVAALFQRQLGWEAITISAAVGLLSFALIRLAGALEPRHSRLLLLGFSVFVLGHAVFLIAPSMYFSPAGSANRSLVAAATGVALVFAAAAAGVARLTIGKSQQSLFSALVALLAFFGTLRIEQVANYWTRVPPIQTKLMAAARQDLGQLPIASFVMLDDVCPYLGPAILFEGPWDTSGAISLAVGREIRADVVSPRMSLTATGLATSMYGERAFYPFGPRLYVYDAQRHVLAKLATRETAQRYFRTERLLRTGCPRGNPGHGVFI